MLKFVLNIASEILEPENLWKVLKSRNYYGQSILTITSDYTSEIFPSELIGKIKKELLEDSPDENIPVLSELSVQVDQCKLSMQRS